MEEDIRKINLAIIQAEYYGSESIIEQIEIKTLKDILNRLDRLQKENKELKKGQNSLMQSRKKWKDRYYREKVAKEEVEEIFENSIPKEKIENLINSLKNDIVNTKIKMEKEEYIDYIRKARLKAFNTKMNEIICKLQELLEEEK